MNRGKDTKVHILERGLRTASQLGLESVTIGTLAKETQLSKSGLFAHFQSKENLQIAILDHAAEDFTDNVILPALKIKGGLPRIRGVVEYWIKWGASLPGGCIFVTAATEYSDRPGRIRDHLIAQQQEWINSLKRLAQSAIKAGDFRADIDQDQFAYDLYSLLLGFHYFDRLLNNPRTKERQETALEDLLSRYCSFDANIKNHTPSKVESP
jgi:AcrR family transcriptional regulator